MELIPYYLPAEFKVVIGRIQQRVLELNGLFMAAHVERLKYDALGISHHANQKHVVKQYVLQYKTTLIRNSDAHFLKQIGEIYTVFKMREISFTESKKALNQ